MWCPFVLIPEIIYSNHYIPKVLSTTMNMRFHRRFWKREMILSKACGCPEWLICMRHWIGHICGWLDDVKRQQGSRMYCESLWSSDYPTLVQALWITNIIFSMVTATHFLKWCLEGWLEMVHHCLDIRFWVHLLDIILCRITHLTLKTVIKSLKKNPWLRYQLKDKNR
jgi:hypothetical protein